VSSTNALITLFSIGDSDTNYNTSLSLTTGQVPAPSGDLGVGSTANNSTTQRATIKSFLILNSSGLLFKPVSPESISILSDVIALGLSSVSGTSLTTNLINRNDYITDSLVNLYYSFGLPLNADDDAIFNVTSSVNGGYADTALSGFGVSKILVIAISGGTYGECIDGKTIKISLPTTAGTYTIYSTYQGGLNTPTVLDANTIETSPTFSIFGPNVAGLVSDNILGPNGGNSTNTWAQGWSTDKPFSLNQKQTFNYQTNANLGVTGDTLVGMAYLDKGFIVINNPTIVNAFVASASTATTVQFNSISTNVFQSVTCIADRGEFGSTTNPTFDVGDVPRFSEVGLYDDSGNLLAYAKSDRQITKNINEFVALGIKIVF
jgi:hypothetical protein